MLTIQAADSRDLMLGTNTIHGLGIMITNPNQGKRSSAVLALENVAEHGKLWFDNNSQILMGLWDHRGHRSSGSDIISALTEMLNRGGGDGHSDVANTFSTLLAQGLLISTAILCKPYLHLFKMPLGRWWWNPTYCQSWRICWKARISTNES